MTDTPVTVSDIVLALGGRNNVAEVCGVTYNAVANWCSWNEFPRSKHLDLAKLCALKSVPLPERLFTTHERKAGAA